MAINVSKEQKPGGVVVKLSGSIEESVNFESIIGFPPPGEMQVNCRDVSRINSVGVKSWIKYFQAAQQKGAKLVFVECSTAIVEQINLISNFTCGGRVESIYVPFACQSCKAELLGLFKCDDLKKLDMDIPPINCNKCSGKAVFDDIPEEYLGFLERLK